MEKIRDYKDFVKAIELYLSQGIKDVQTLTKLVNKRGVICYPVAIELYLEKKERLKNESDSN